jgi:hypothetical protein
MPIDDGRSSFPTLKKTIAIRFHRPSIASKQATKTYRGTDFNVVRAKAFIFEFFILFYFI